MPDVSVDIANLAVVLDVADCIELVMKQNMAETCYAGARGKAVGIEVDNAGVYLVRLMADAMRVMDSWSRLDRRH